MNDEKKYFDENKDFDITHQIILAKKKYEILLNEMFKTLFLKKKQCCQILNISEHQLDLAISKFNKSKKEVEDIEKKANSINRESLLKVGDIPDFEKMGDKKQSPVRFPLASVALFLAKKEVKLLGI